MASDSIRDIHLRTSDSVPEVADGAITVTERRGEPGFEWRPMSLPDLSELWQRLPAVPGESGRFLEEDR